MRAFKILLAVVALAALALSALNAPWFAPTPAGHLLLVAHRGVAQPVDPAKHDPCSAHNLRPTDHLFIENSQFGMQAALRFGAEALLLDVRASADGTAVIFRDAALDCRTNGSGEVGERPLAYLKTLDIGYGYSADNGRTFPLRGRGVGGMLTIEEVLRAFSRDQLIFELADARAAEAAVAGFARAGVPIGPTHGFTGPPEALARLRQLTPNGWILDRAASAACLRGYRRTGWFGSVPDDCRGLTLNLPYAGEWTLWGWPYRFLDRMHGVGARAFLSADPDGPILTGLDRPEQTGEVGARFTGFLLIEDMNDVGRAIMR